jgi:S-disulfanyl-L-cysteine oxidoreductase SoxD
MRYSLNLAAPLLAVTFASVAALAQTSIYSNVGRPPSQEEIRAGDIAVGIDGEGLPPGSGTAKEGAQVYAKKCAGCHGPNLEGRPSGDIYSGYAGQRLDVPIAPALAGGKGTLSSNHPVRTVGSYWPFATSVWDYINRAMPRGQERSLSADEVYAVTAFVLYKNDIVKENDSLDAKSLPKIQMPNRNGFLPARIEDIPDLRKRGCHLGQCPEPTNSK